MIDAMISITSLLLSSILLTASANVPRLRGINNAVLNPTRYPDQEATTFEPAITLKKFRNVDPDLFEWVNKTEIVEEGITCGFLKAPLGALPDIIYPIVQVYVCVRFAKNQPAPKGNLAVHCGGPGTHSGCGVYDMALFYLGNDIIADYNLISFDQRGIGRSKPSFVIKECAVDTYDSTGLVRKMINFADESTLRDDAKLYKKRAAGCWKHPDFRLKVETEDGKNKSYHFLEYSGTRQVAEDMDRVRKIFGDQKLSLYGISYGTKVMGAYATVFSDKVNLMVLDGNDDPNTDILQNAIDLSRTIDQRIDYFISSCEMNPESCPVNEMRYCINKIKDIVDEHIDDLKAASAVPTTPADLMLNVIQYLFNHVDGAPALCNATEAGDYQSVKEILIKPESKIFLTEESRYSFFPQDAESLPTSGESDSWPSANYSTLVPLIADIITAQDYSFGAYDEDLYIQFLMDLNKKYPGAGTTVPAIRGKVWYSACYMFPNITPMPPLGNPELKGIIAGQIYDPNTPYIWTQKMRENFPSATLLTSRSDNHGLIMANERMVVDPNCHSNVLRYFETGIVDFPDGTVCESDPIGDACTVEEVITSQGCSGGWGKTNAVVASVE